MLQEESKKIFFQGRVFLLIIFITTAGILSFFSHQSVMAEDNRKILSLGEIVVTGTRSEKKIEEVPAYSTVITGEQLERRNILTLDEALRYQNGLSSLMVQDMTGGSRQISLRGFKGQGRTQILFNGHPINGGYNGKVDWAGLPVSGIDRIEIVRGPYSPLYGGVAMGGVIHIIPKEIEKMTLDLKELYGEDGTKGFRFYSGSKIGDRLSLSLSLEQKKTDGYIDQYVVKSIGSGTGGGGAPPGGGSGSGATIPVTGWSKTQTPTGKDAYLLGDKGEHWSESGSFASQLTFALSPSMTLKALFMNSCTEDGFSTPHSNLLAPNGNTVFKGSLQLEPNQPKPLVLLESDFLNSQSQKKKNTYQGAFAHRVSDTAGYKVIMGYTDEYRNRTLSPSKQATLKAGAGTLTDTPSTSLHMEGENHVTLGDHGLTFGAGYFENDVEDEEWSLVNWLNPATKLKRETQTKGEDETLYALLQDEYILKSDLNILLGLRYDHWESTGQQTDAQGTKMDFTTHKEENVSQRLGFLYNLLPNTKIRGMIGTAFRTPPIHALYRTNRSTNQITLMNPDLEPEKTFSWELGGDWAMTESSSLRLTYFENRIKDMIYPRLSDPNTTPDTYIKENTGEGRTKGIECEVEHQLTSWLSWWGNLTYQEAKITENPATPSSEGKRVPLVPWATANIGLDMVLSHLEASLTGQYRGKVYKQDDNSDTVNRVPGSYDPYFILNAKIGYRIREWLKLSLSVDNVFDRDYYEFNKAAGRRFFAEISCNY